MALEDAALAALRARKETRIAVIIHLFNEALKELECEALAKKEGWINNHPIIRIFIDCLVTVSGACGRGPTEKLSDFVAVEKMALGIVARS